MEPILHTPNSVKGLEILYFDNADLQKIKNFTGTVSFAVSGPLSVLYFKDYDRFVLQLNDWRYPLIRRLPVASTTGKDIEFSRSYVFPALNGFTYHLTITSRNYTQGLSNLDTILEHNSRLSSKGKETHRKHEVSPDDKLMRNIKKDTDIKEVIAETIKEIQQKAENIVCNLKASKKPLTSTKKRLNLKDIKTKNFRKEAHSRINKNFFQSAEKLSHEFLQRRRDNINLSQMKEYEELKKTSDHQAPVLYLPRVEIEGTILNNKDILAQSGLVCLFGAHSPETKQDFIFGERNRERNVMTSEELPISGGLVHDQA